MFKSLLSKYLLVFIVLIIVSFTILTFIFFNVFSEYSYNINEQAIRSTSESVQKYLGSSLQSFSSADNFSSKIHAMNGQISGYINRLPKFSEEMCIFITDNTGNIILNGSSSKELVKTDYIPSDIVENLKLKVKSDNYFENVSSQMKGVLVNDSYAFVKPIYAKNNEFAGVIVTATSTAVLSQMLKEITTSIIIAVLVVIVFTVLVVYLITKRITKPLATMAKAASKFGKGDFSVRVPVKGKDEVAKLSLSFNNMASTLEGSDRMKTDFLSSVSHELRSPLTSINGFVDSMLDGHIPPEDHEKYLEIVSSEVKRLSRLISSIMDISRINSGDKKFNFTVFNICETARKILISLEQKIEGKKLEVEFETDSDDMYVKGDEDSVYQILYNICQNAIKFSYEGGLLRISIKTKDKKTFVSVFNEGIGIEESELPFVFERFYKSDKSRGMDKTGVGLGMYLAKSIIDAHDEEIWVTSEFGKNCEFVFTLKSEKSDKSRNNF